MSNRQDLSYPATAAIEQFRLVSTATGSVTATAGSTTKPYGVAQNSADASGDLVTVQLVGIALCTVDGSGTNVAVGDELMPAAGGKLVAHVAATGNYRCARALQASTTANAEIFVLLYDRLTADV